MLGTTYTPLAAAPVPSANKRHANGMGKRKPSMPRRRVGVHFADLAVQRSVHALHGSLPTSASVLSPAVVNGAWNSAAPQAAGGSPSLPSDDASAPTTTGSPTHPSSDMSLQKDRPAPSMPLHPFGKSIVSTVAPQANRDTLDGNAKALDDTVTMKVSELEAWKQRTIMQIEDHFTNEQLKRIAEFGRVHANLVKEAKEYVSNVETQLKEQFERDRESLKSQAEAYVAQFQQESEDLKRRVKYLEDELEELRRGKDAVANKEVTPTLTTDGEADELEPSAKRGRRSDSGDFAFRNDSAPSSPSVSSSPTAAKSTAEAVAVDDVAEEMSRAMAMQTPQRLKPRDSTRVTASEATGLKIPALPL